MDNANHFCETDPGESSANRQQSAGIKLELQTNQSVLNGLLNWYSVFAFTGGAVPSGHCELAAVNSYLDHPFATDCILTGEVERYRCLIESIMMPQAGIPVRPRTLRGRKQIADAFGRTAAEIEALGNRFAAALTARGPSVSL
jgi:hypothetical protein